MKNVSFNKIYNFYVYIQIVNFNFIKKTQCFTIYFKMSYLKNSDAYLSQIRKECLAIHYNTFI